MIRTFGIAAGSAAELAAHESALGRRIHAVRVFRRWGDPLLPDWVSDRAPYVSVKPNFAWRDFPAHQAQAVEYGRQAAAHPGPVYLAFHHEMDAVGTGAAEFVTAYRAFAKAVRSVAKNVRLVWIVTGYGLETGRAQAFYPGDDVVDLIGVDTYNFYNTASPSGTWAWPAQKLAPILVFLSKHPTKKAILAEWSSVEDPAQPGRKASYIRSMRMLLKQPGHEQITGLLFWPGRNNVSFGGRFDYNTSASAETELRKMALDPDYAA